MCSRSNLLFPLERNKRTLVTLPFESVSTATFILPSTLRFTAHLGYFILHLRQAARPLALPLELPLLFPGVERFLGLIVVVGAVATLPVVPILLLILLPFVLLVLLVAVFLPVFILVQVGVNRPSIR